MRKAYGHPRRKFSSAFDLFSARLKNSAPAILFVSLCFCLFFHGVWGGKLLLAVDPLLYSLPLRTVAWEMIRRGELPLWTDLILSGYPLLSMAQLGLAYPLTWGYLFLPNYIAEQIYVLVPFLLAPLFTYAWLRELGRSRAASLLSGLGFGYGGMMASLLSNGMMPNAVMWLPLLLIALKRARRENFLLCVLGATAACTMSLLAGIAQGFLLVMLTAFAWSLFQTLPIAGDGSQELRQRMTPLLTLVCAAAASACLAAFQLLETMQAARHSIRDKLSYTTFTEMAFPPSVLWKSFLAPLYHHEGWIEVTAFISWPAVLLALFAVIIAVVPGRAERVFKAEVIFWAAIAGTALLLMMGDAAPLYSVLYRIPVLNQFRAPSRHAFEWSFAINIVAAFGLDALRDAWRSLRPNPSIARGVLCSAALLGAAIVGALWWMATADNPPKLLLLGRGGGEASYIVWKAIFTLLLATGGLLALTTHSARRRSGLIMTAVFLVCLVEPYILMSRWWGRPSIAISRVKAVSPVTQFLREHSPEQNRVYTRVHVGVEQFTPTPSLDSPNLTALYGLHNVAGYEPLMMRRYSRALGNAGRDAVHPGYADPPDDALFEPRSRVLDILNATFVAAFSNMQDLAGPLIEKEGVQFSAGDLSGQKPEAKSLVLDCSVCAGDTLNIVTTLANSIAVEQEAPVAKVRIHTTDDRVIERDLRAGVDVAEWAHEQADVRRVIKHSMAPIYDCNPGDKDNSFSACRFWARIPLDRTLSVKAVEVIELADLTVWKATLYDSATRQSTPLSLETEPDQRAWRNTQRWAPVFERQGAMILRNLNAMPRAWLVAQAEQVSETEALKRIRGESENPFDPRQTALLEIPPGEAPPALPGGTLPPEAALESLIYQPNGLKLKTSADRPSLLVVSQMNYPGWAATVDGGPAKIYTADYLLQAVALPAGRHSVELSYHAPAAAKGAVISGITFLLLLTLILLARQRRK
jgi:hypothetical protein